ncbi:MAG TPA: PAS domain S-box protein [Ferruginibacter sp.]|nr:PAS domain S-box protein [Ferruginibacter sp.]
MKNNNTQVQYTPFLKAVAVQSRLNHKEDSYRAIVENSVHAFFLTDAGGTILEANHAATAIFGYPHEEFRLVKPSRFIDYTDPNLLQAIKERENTGFAITEATGIKKNGERFPVEISSSFFTDINGERRTSSMVSDISIRKQAEAAMRLSNERFDLVVKATNDLVWDWNLLTGEIYRSGSSLSGVYGHSSNEMISSITSWSDHLHPLDKERISQLIEYYTNSKEETAFSFEYRFRKEDGDYAYISDKGYIIRNDEGRVIRMIGAAEDITKSKNTAIAIEESEQRYKMFVQQSTEGIWRIELKEAIPITMPVEELVEYCYKNASMAECNDKFAKMYGFEKAEDIIGTPLQILLPRENSLNTDFLLKFFKNGFKIEEEPSFEKDKEGNEVIFVNSMVGIIEGEYIKRIWGTQRNITEQKKAENLLLTSEEKYRDLFNNNPSCIFIWDTETLQIMEINQAAMEVYGYTREEFLHLSALDLRPKSDQPAFFEVVKNVRRDKKYQKTNTWRHINKQGEIIFMEIASHSIIYNGRKSLFAIANNVTEKVQLENSLNEEREIRQQQITEAVIQGQEKERTGLGEELHDNINQILASTKLYIECALKNETPRKDLIIESKALLERAMNEIRTLSKSLLPPSLGEIGLSQALLEMIENIKYVNDLSISVDLNNVDENQLGNKIKLTIFRIVQEQLNNVIKHAEANTVLISIRKENEMIQLSIKDNGQGFDVSEKRNGVGLRNIISRAGVNNGTVIIDSKPGAGCELLVNFGPCNVQEEVA